MTTQQTDTKGPEAFSAGQIANGRRLLRETTLPDWAVADACLIPREHRAAFFAALPTPESER